jgi:hypothetical protein
MLNIDEIEGALDDDFRDMLESFDDNRLKHLLANPVALTRLRPASITSRRARTMARAVLEARAHPPELIPAEIKLVKRRRLTPPKPAHRPSLPPPAEECGATVVPAEAPPASESAPLIAPPPVTRTSEQAKIVLAAILALAGVLALLL